MVDLGRQISVTRAQQGGFSAHILPETLRYDGFETIIAYATPSGFQVVGSYESVSIPTPVSGLISSSGGPFGEPCANAVNQNSIYSIALGNASPGIVDFTLEWWFRLVFAASGGSQFNMMSVFSNVSASGGGIVNGTSNAPSLIQFISYVPNSNIFTYTLIFSAPVTNFTAEDVTINNGTLLSFTANSSTEYVIVTQGSEDLEPGRAPSVVITGSYNYPGQGASQSFFEHQISGNGQRRTRATVLPSVWNHAAIVRSGLDHRCYLNGTLVTSVTQSQDYAEPVNISNASISSGVVTQINIGQMRYTKSAIYSGTTIPVPTAPFFVP
jgi:hypothetical protein